LEAEVLESEEEAEEKVLAPADKDRLSAEWWSKVCSHIGLLFADKWSME
jgi:hypothetical protein